MANKVYKKGKVHPTLTADDHLSLFLPAAILALAASLPLRDKEVLSYFLSCSGCADLVATRPSAREMKGRAEDHAPQFECSCFGCYVSFWSRWDSSPNRHVIDEIVEAFEEHERRDASRGRVRKGRKEWKKRGGGGGGGGGGDELPSGGAAGEGGEAEEAAGEDRGEEEEEEEEKRGLVRRIGTTIGFKIWNFLDRITM